MGLQTVHASTFAVFGAEMLAKHCNRVLVCSYGLLCKEFASVSLVAVVEQMSVPR